jgi:hypothetical protein
MSVLANYRYSVLLTALLLLLLTEPLARGFMAGLVVYDVVLTCALLSVFMIVFHRRSEQIAAIVLGLPAIVSRWAAYALTDEPRAIAMAAHKGFTLVFCGFAVAIIVRGIFEGRTVRADHVIGTVCGYLLAGVAWGNFYALADQCNPDSFSVKPELAWQTSDPHSRSFLFNYFSFCILTAAHNDDITPIGPFVASSTWIEAMCGHFYLAVVVAQLVGLKLAQATRDASRAGP